MRLAARSRSTMKTLRWGTVAVAVLIFVSSAASQSAAQEAGAEIENSAVSEISNDELPKTDGAQLSRYSAGATLFDAAFLRPMGALSLIGGSLFFAVTSPLVLMQDSEIADYGRTWDTFVIAPYEYTFERPLGDL